MITEDYVSFETAKLLTEKGFDEPCFAYYYIYNDLEGKCLKLWRKFPRRPANTDYLNAPTHQMAMKWLREVHKISIEITSTGYNIDNDVEWECDIKTGHRLYFSPITCEKSFESVAEKAIEYCLKYLI